MGTILWCYLRNNSFEKDKDKDKDKDYHLSADLTATQIIWA
jgi:DhnA family fructose-bisphosphate aldolase class Ia